MGLILHFEAGLGFCSLTVTMQHGAKRLKDEESHLSFSLSKTKNFSMTNSAWNQIIARHFLFHRTSKDRGRNPGKKIDLFFSIFFSGE